MQSYSRDVLAFLFLVLTLVAMATSRVQHKVPLLLNRKQTEEWKGWMQVASSYLCTGTITADSALSEAMLAQSIDAWIFLMH